MRELLTALLATLGLGILAPIFLWHSFNGVLWMLETQSWSPFTGPAPQVGLFLQQLQWIAPSVVVVYHLLVALLAHRAVLNLLQRREFNAGK